jgi:hypothetical protein
MSRAICISPKDRPTGRCEGGMSSEAAVQLRKAPCGDLTPALAPAGGSHSQRTARNRPHGEGVT